MSTAWIVVADTCRARIFESETPSSPLTEIQTLSHPEARLHEGDLLANSTNQEIGNEENARQELANKFASQVCEALECGRTNRRYKKLYVIAAPSFLGMLRKQQSNSLQKLVASEISKNLATHDVSDIRKNLPDYL